MFYFVVWLKGTTFGSQSVQNERNKTTMNLSNQPRPARRSALKVGDTFTHFCPYAKKEYTETIIEIHEDGIFCDWTFSWGWADLEEAGIIRRKQTNQKRKPRTYRPESSATFHLRKAAREGVIGSVLEYIKIHDAYMADEIEFSDVMKSKAWRETQIWASSFFRDAFWVWEIVKNPIVV